MKYKNHRISTLKSWLTKTPKERTRITNMYKPLTKREKSSEKNIYKDENQN